MSVIPNLETVAIVRKAAMQGGLLSCFYGGPT
jgi:hypothetical protein